MTVQNSWLFVLLIPAAVLVGVFCDWDRLKAHLEDRGGRLLRMRWAPFGKGWWGEGSDRIYHVRYLDPDGNERHAFCKTSMGSGVYFPDDKIVRYSQPRKVPEPDFRAENQRLREEIIRLKTGGTVTPGEQAD